MDDQLYRRTLAAEAEAEVLTAQIGLVRTQRDTLAKVLCELFQTSHDLCGENGCLACMDGYAALAALDEEAKE